MTVEGMKLQSLWYFIGGLPQFQQMTRPFPGIPESVKTKFRQHDYSIWTQHQGEAIFGFNSKMTTEEFHKSVHKVHIEHLNMIPKYLQTQFCNSNDSPRKLGKPPFQDITTKPSIAMVHDFIHFVFQSL